MMIVKKAGAASAAPVSFDLGHGAVLKARALDAFESKMVAAEARAELNAIVAGDAPQRAWPTLEPRFAQIRVDTVAQAAALSWMHAVLLASACAVALEGVVGEDGAPLTAGFEAFELLFNDSGVETAFRLKAYRIEEIWSAEKNVSGPGPNGPGPEAASTAQPAKPPETPAQAADGETTAAAAPSQTQHPEPPKAPSPGTPPPAAEAGNSSD